MNLDGRDMYVSAQFNLRKEDGQTARAETQMRRKGDHIRAPGQIRANSRVLHGGRMGMRVHGPSVAQ